MNTFGWLLMAIEKGSPGSRCHSTDQFDSFCSLFHSHMDVVIFKLNRRCGIRTMYVDQEYYFRNAKAKSHQTITRDLLVWNAILSVEQTSTPLNEKKRHNWRNQQQHNHVNKTVIIMSDVHSSGRLSYDSWLQPKIHFITTRIIVKKKRFENICVWQSVLSAVSFHQSYFTWTKNSLSCLIRYYLDIRNDHITQQKQNRKQNKRLMHRGFSCFISFKWIVLMRHLHWNFHSHPRARCRIEKKRRRKNAELVSPRKCRAHDPINVCCSYYTIVQVKRVHHSKVYHIHCPAYMQLWASTHRSHDWHAESFNKQSKRKIPTQEKTNVRCCDVRSRLLYSKPIPLWVFFSVCAFR